MSTAKNVAQLRDIPEQGRGDGTRTVQAQLDDLSDKFNIAVRAIDPSVTGAIVIYDEGDRSFKRQVGIYFERPDTTLPNSQYGRRS